MSSESELRQLSQETAQLIRSSKSLSARSETVRRQALDKSREFERKRILRLREILKEKGFGFCSACLGDFSSDGKIHSKLGLFPKTELRLLYVENYERGGCGYERETQLLKRLSRVCPEHYPKFALPRIVPFDAPLQEICGQNGLVASVVAERDGKRFALDINKEEVELEESISPMIPELSIDQLSRYFGLPEIPKITV